jgi:uncharacterized protein involved in exopolysaccharide biosynthesis
MVVPAFNLLSIAKTLRNNKRLIIMVTLIAMAAGSAVFLLKKKKYKATTAFFVNSPLYGDRSTLFRSHETRYVDYFGGDDDVDRVMALIGSDTVKQKILRQCRFDIIYKKDINIPRENQELINILNKNMNVIRTEFKEVEISYTAYDSATPANVANTAAHLLEETFRNYYTATKESMSFSIKSKIKELDSSILVLTDTLAAMRDQYGIYSIISPTRQPIASAEIRGGGKGYGRAIEEIQNIEAIKDELVMDKAKYVSVLNELSASSNAAMEYIKIITTAKPAVKPAGPELIVVIISIGLLSFFFTLLFLLTRDYYRLLSTSIDDAISAEK